MERQLVVFDLASNEASPRKEFFEDTLALGHLCCLGLATDDDANEDPDECSDDG